MRRDRTPANQFSQQFKILKDEKHARNLAKQIEETQLRKEQEELDKLTPFMKYMKSQKSLGYRTQGHLSSANLYQHGQHAITYDDSKTFNRSPTYTESQVMLIKEN